MKFEIFLISCQPNGLWMLFNWIWITSLGFCRDKENNKKKDVDFEKLASARKRLQENYKEAENGSLIFFSTSTVNLLDSSIWLMLKLFVFVCFTLVKPKGKERFRWWTSMRSQNPRMPSLERTKVVVVAVLTGGTGDWIRQIIHTKGYMREAGKAKTHCASYVVFWS